MWEYSHLFINNKLNNYKKIPIETYRSGGNDTKGDNTVGTGGPTLA